MAAPTYSGRRVVYRGPVFDNAGVAPAYTEELQRGIRRAPTAGERLALRPGDEGTVGAYLGTDDSGHRYEVDFDNGVMIDVTLPSSLVAFADSR